MAGTHKVDADRADIAVGEAVVSEPQQQTALADAGIANQDEFEQVIATALVSDRGRRRSTGAPLLIALHRRHGATGPADVDPPPD